MKLELEIPDQLISSLGFRKDKLNEEIKKELSVHFFEQGKFSFGQARSFSGLNKWDFMDLLRERKVSLNYNPTDYDEDMETISKLGL